MHLPGEVPSCHSASNDKLLTGQDELGDPDECHQVVPPHVTHWVRAHVLYTGEILLIVHCRVTWTSSESKTPIYESTANLLPAPNDTVTLLTSSANEGQYNGPVGKEATQQQEGPDGLEQQEGHVDQALASLMEESHGQRQTLPHH